MIGEEKIRENIERAEKEIQELQAQMAEHKRDFAHEITECGTERTYRLWAEARRRRDDWNQYLNIHKRLLED